jgi:membrane associated rhomboid family serine protease
LELSDQGKNLILVVLGGLVAGTVFALVSVDGYPLTLLLLQDNSYVTKGWVWQLITSVIIAPPNLLGLIDVAFNAMALAWLDGFFYLTYTETQYYAVFLITAVAGNIFSLANGPGVTSFGASGGIFGLLAGVVSFDLVTNRKLNPGLILWFVCIFLVSSSLSSYVDWIAHAGGAVFGLALGYVVGVRRGVDPLAA